MEHVVLALILMAFTVLCAYLVDRRHASRHSHEHDVDLRAKAMSDYHVTR
jgi:hypothetical protein